MSLKQNHSEDVLLIRRKFKRLRRKNDFCSHTIWSGENLVCGLRKTSSGFSMVEVMIAAIILSISVLGILSTLSAQKGPTAESDKKVQAALAAKQFLEGLRGKVDAMTYDTGDLSLGMHSNVPYGGYTINYFVSLDGKARKVDLNIAW